VYLGVDPALDSVGVASWESGAWGLAHVDGIEEMGACPLLVSFWEDPDVRIVAAIERAAVYLPGVGRRFAASQGASSRVEALLRKRFPRRSVVQRVNVGQWRTALFGKGWRQDGDDPKGGAERYFTQVLGLRVPDGIRKGAHSDVWEAACLCEYARRVVALQQAARPSR